MNDAPHDLRRKALTEVEAWAHELARKLSPDDAWRLLMGGVIAVMQAEHTPAEIAAAFHQLADTVEDGANRPSIQ